MILPLQIYREFLHTATAKLRQEYIEAQAPWREAPHRPISGIPPYSTPSSTSFLSIPPFESPGPKTTVLSLSYYYPANPWVKTNTTPTASERTIQRQPPQTSVCPRRPSSLLQPLPPDLFAFCTLEVGPHRSHGVSTFASCCSTSGIRLLTLNPVILFSIRILFLP